LKLVEMDRELEPAGEPDAIPINPYPYGLAITLGEDELMKLGLKELPEAGTRFKLEAIGVVTRAESSDHDADGDVDYQCCTVQITELGMETEKKPKGAAEKLYGRDTDDDGLE